jgi:hypothetical protein
MIGRAARDFAKFERVGSGSSADCFSRLETKRGIRVLPQLCAERFNARVSARLRSKLLFLFVLAQPTIAG